MNLDGWGAVLDGKVYLGNEITDEIFSHNYTRLFTDYAYIAKHSPTYAMGGWTKEKPTQTGFYWHYGALGCEMVEIIKDWYGNLALGGYNQRRSFPYDMDGFWMGPIKPPELPKDVTK